MAIEMVKLNVCEVPAYLIDNIVSELNAHYTEKIITKKDVIGTINQRYKNELSKREFVKMLSEMPLDIRNQYRKRDSETKKGYRKVAPLRKMPTPPSL